jgi:hypothetical protein
MSKHLQLSVGFPSTSYLNHNMSMRTRPLWYLFLRSQLTQATTICPGCLRFLATTAAKQAGHNKWSKTKHIKAVTDKKKMADRTHFAKTIAMYSRMFGEDLQFNPQLANAVTAAAKGTLPQPRGPLSLAQTVRYGSEHDSHKFREQLVFQSTSSTVP